jgi:predicted dehydrogenase
MTNIAVIGAGQWGPNLIRNFYDFRDTKVLYVVDRDEARLRVIRESYPSLTATPDASRPFSDPKVDAVVIATPASSHHHLASQAIAGGKHLLVEKPLCFSVEQAQELVDRADRAGVLLMVGHVFLFNPGIRRMKQLIDDGELGRVLYVDTVRTNLGPVRVDANALWDLAAHDISIVNYWLESNGLRVSATGTRALGQTVEDACYATIEYPGNVIAHLHVSWLNPRKVRQITVVGDRRMAVWDDIDLTRSITIYDRRVDRPGGEPVDSFGSHRIALHMGDVVIPNVPQSEPLKNECRHFIDCVVRGERCLSGGQTGVDVVRTLSASDRSLAAGGAYTEIV